MSDGNAPYPRRQTEQADIRHQADQLLFVFAVSVLVLLIGKVVIFFYAEDHFPRGEIQEEQADDAMTVVLVGLLQLAVGWATAGLTRIKRDPGKGWRNALTAIRVMCFVPVVGLFAPLAGNLALRRMVRHRESGQ